MKVGTKSISLHEDIIIFDSYHTTAFQKKSIDISVLIGYTVISYME